MTFDLSTGAGLEIETRGVTSMDMVYHPVQGHQQQTQLHVSGNKPHRYALRQRFDTKINCDVYSENVTILL